MANEFASPVPGPQRESPQSLQDRGEPRLLVPRQGRQRCGGDRPGLLDAVARLPFAWAFGAAAKEVSAAELDEATKRELIKYLAAVPMTAVTGMKAMKIGDDSMPRTRFDVSPVITPALTSVSRHSSCGLESATMPAPTE